VNIYVASSWRNKLFTSVIERLRREGWTVYDFKNPVHSFSWKDIDAHWQQWTPDRYREALTSTLAEKGYANDMGALRDADAVVLVLPAGASAHAEAGWAAGAHKPVFVLVPEGPLDALYDVKATTHAVAQRAPWEPELMYKMFTGGICTSIDEVVEGLGRYFARLDPISQPLDEVTVEVLYGHSSWYFGVLSAMPTADIGTGVVVVPFTGLTREQSASATLVLNRNGKVISKAKLLPYFNGTQIVLPLALPQNFESLPMLSRDEVEYLKGRLKKMLEK
jgi:hypothetical protein